MRHSISTPDAVDVRIELPIEDLQDLVHDIGSMASGVIVVYMLADTIRHVLKRD